MLWTILVVWFSIFTLTGGCGVRYKYEKYNTLESPIYAATRIDFYIIYNAWFNQNNKEASIRTFRALAPLAIIDLPFAAVIDTVALPYDWHIQNKRKTQVDEEGDDGEQDDVIATTNRFLDPEGLIYIGETW